jgi:hypothetical protein
MFAIASLRRCRAASACVKAHGLGMHSSAAYIGDFDAARKLGKTNLRSRIVVVKCDTFCDRKVRRAADCGVTCRARVPNARTFANMRSRCASSFSALSEGAPAGKNG